MMSTDGKDKFDAKFDAMVASTMREGLDASGRDCPEADVLAAFAATTLGADEQTRWESHIARCALCQRALAALARAGAVAPVAAEQPHAAQSREASPAARPGDFAAAPAMREEEDSGAESESIFAAVRRGVRFMLGPFPLSVTLHLIVLLFLIITVHEQRGRELIMVNLEAGGGGGGGNEMQDLDMPEVPMPDTAPQQMDNPQAVDTSQAVGLANDYVRAAGGGGIGIGRGGGMGAGYGHGIGSGFGGFIGELRRKGLDVVLVIDGTGSMNLIIDDVKAKMAQLIQSIHRLVPIARVGIIIFGGKGEAM
ncbi:MAG: hypothetical protein ACLQDV_16030, partial [Candidatus Binataceae bacterium]